MEKKFFLSVCFMKKMDAICKMEKNCRASQMMMMMMMMRNRQRFISFYLISNIIYDKNIPRNIMSMIESETDFFQELF